MTGSCSTTAVIIPVGNYDAVAVDHEGLAFSADDMFRYKVGDPLSVYNGTDRTYVFPVPVIHRAAQDYTHRKVAPNCSEYVGNLRPAGGYRILQVVAAGKIGSYAYRYMGNVPVVDPYRGSKIVVYHVFAETVEFFPR